MKIGVFEIDGNEDDRSTRSVSREDNVLTKEGEVIKPIDPVKYEYIDRIKMHQSIGDTAGYYDKAKDLMEQNKELDFVQRALDASDTTNPVLGNSTHRMSYFGPEDNGDYMMYPEVIRDPENPKQLKEFNNATEARDHAITSGEFVNIGPDPFFAEYITRVGYKFAFPKGVYDEAVSDYIKSW